jgi:hypothetical protein
MINISWGTKIAILYISFVALIVFMVALSMTQKIDLVSEDYYAKELDFQNSINEQNNANALTEAIQHEVVNNGLKIKFPEVFKNKAIKGNIMFYRPSDKSKDFSIDIALDNNLEQSADLKLFSKGMYKMKVSWSAEDVNYFTEQVIVMP